MLRIGSVGEAVRTLQQALNRAPTALPRLSEDAQFGPKTQGRVYEFQRKSNIAADGVVGPQTWGELEPWMKFISHVVDNYIPSPAAEEAARAKILSLAENFHAHWGWLPGDMKFTPTNPRIAGRFCADATTRARQGGVALATIFQVAGDRDPSKCLTISASAVQKYNTALPGDNWRNSEDIPSWCGYFVLFVMKTAGLKLSSWPLRSTQEESAKREFETVTGEVKPGDVGIDNRKGQNHHFLVRAVRGGLVDSFDGNAGIYQSIVKYTGEYSIGNMRKHGTSGFIRPIWDRVLK